MTGTRPATRPGRPAVTLAALPPGVVVPSSTRLLLARSAAGDREVA